VDVTTQGRWIGVYGHDGFAIPGYFTNYPAYAAVDFANATERVYFPENNARDLLRLDRDEHILSVWRVGGTVNLQFLDGSNHVLAVYFLDVERARHQRVAILNADTEEKLSEVDLPAFGDGQYLVWHVRGHLKLELSIVQGGEPYISGLFFDQAAPTLAFAETSTRLLRAEDGGLLVEIRRRPASDNEVLAIEVSRDLVEWHPAEGEIESIQTGIEEGTQVVTLRLSKSARAAERGFFRARFRPSP
jgi:hypothetical protein